jgi:hypothetical protein
MLLPEYVSKSIDEMNVHPLSLPNQSNILDSSTIIYISLPLPKAMQFPGIILSAILLNLIMHSNEKNLFGC